MKNIILVILIGITSISFGQDIENERLWRTKGVYDSLGNFIERAKIQSFLYGSKPDQFQRLSIKSKVHMESGETKIFVYRDTLNLASLDENIYRINDKETLTFHSKDSITIHFNGFTLPYTKLDAEPNLVDVKKFRSELTKEPLIESTSDAKEYRFTYQNNEFVKVKPLDRDSEWESEYKIIEFNGFIFLQGIISAPKLITKSKKGKIEFLEIDYRFENKTGELNSIR